MASPLDWILLRITGQLSSVQLVRAGELVFGTGPVSPIQGWTSPTYGDKIPALSVIIETRGQLPLTLTSEFIFPANVAR